MIISYYHHNERVHEVGAPEELFGTLLGERGERY